MAGPGLGSYLAEPSLPRVEELARVHRHEPLMIYWRNLPQWPPTHGDGWRPHLPGRGELEPI